jgi:preprotein translocase subunit SecG
MPATCRTGTPGKSPDRSLRPLLPSRRHTAPAGGKKTCAAGALVYINKIMATAIVILHVIVCFALISIVLLQHGKGAGIGAAFGGSSQTVFGSTGAAPFLAKLTAVAAILFMLTSLSLSFMSRQQEASVMQGLKPNRLPNRPRRPRRRPPRPKPATPGPPAAPKK